MANVAGLDRLKSQLLTSGLQQKDQPLYQVINQLIEFVRQEINETQANFDAITGGGSLLSQSFITTQNELTSLPFSRRLVAGGGISFNNDGQRLVINGVSLPGMDGEPGPEGMMGPQGIQGPAGTTTIGSPLGATGYYWSDDEDNREPAPLYTLQNQLSIPETAITDGTLLARIAANETITGNWIFNSGVTSFEGTSPQVIIRDTSAPLDEKYWRYIAAGGDLYTQGLNDVFAGAFSAMIIRRTGAIGNYIEMPLGLALTGQSSVALNADQTAWNPTGLGILFFISVTPTGAFNIRGLTAAASGMLVCFYNTTANTISFFHEDAAAAAANRFNLPNGVGFGVLAFQAATFYYNGISSRWVVISKGA